MRIRAAGLCHSDLSVINGDRPRPVPMALGHEAAGEVMRTRRRRHRPRGRRPVALVFVPSCDSDVIHLRDVVAFIVPLTATMKPFLAKRADPADDVERMHQAWFKAVTLTAALWSQAFVPPRTSDC